VWTVEPEEICKKVRVPGISGFMRLKNESAYLDKAIESHLPGLDELIIVFNDCQDDTPEICSKWADRHPDKIKVFEYQPRVIPIGTPESLRVDPRSPNCIANYYNYSLSLTNRKIAIKIDGDHIAVSKRFARICDRVRRDLPRNGRYPIYGLNITQNEFGEVAIYNYYDFAPDFVGDRRAKKGPPPFTSGDHAFFYVDESSWHTVDPVEGFEVLNLKGRSRFPRAALTYCFFHMKGMKLDRGTANWLPKENRHLRKDWVSNVLAPDGDNLASIDAMRAKNPAYFRGAKLHRELRAILPDLELKTDGPPKPALGLREKMADFWYRLAYP